MSTKERILKEIELFVDEYDCHEHYKTICFFSTTTVRTIPLGGMKIKDLIQKISEKNFVNMLNRIDFNLSVVRINFSKESIIPIDIFIHWDGRKNWLFVHTMFKRIVECSANLNMDITENICNLMKNSRFYINPEYLGLKIKNDDDIQLLEILCNRYSVNKIGYIDFILDSPCTSIFECLLSNYGNNIGDKIRIISDGIGKITGEFELLEKVIGRNNLIKSFHSDIRELVINGRNDIIYNFINEICPSIDVIESIFVRAALTTIKDCEFENYKNALQILIDNGANFNMIEKFITGTDCLINPNIKYLFHHDVNPQIFIAYYDMIYKDKYLSDQYVFC